MIIISLNGLLNYNFKILNFEFGNIGGIILQHNNSGRVHTGDRWYVDDGSGDSYPDQELGVYMSDGTTVNLGGIMMTWPAATQTIGHGRDNATWKLSYTTRTITDETSAKAAQYIQFPGEFNLRGVDYGGVNYWGSSPADDRVAYFALSESIPDVTGIKIDISNIYNASDPNMQGVVLSAVALYEV